MDDKGGHWLVDMQRLRLLSPRRAARCPHRGDPVPRRGPGLHRRPLPACAPSLRTPAVRVMPGEPDAAHAWGHHGQAASFRARARNGGRRRNDRGGARRAGPRPYRIPRPSPGRPRGRHGPVQAAGRAAGEALGRCGRARRSGIMPAECVDRAFEGRGGRHGAIAHGGKGDGFGSARRWHGVPAPRVPPPGPPSTGAKGQGRPDSRPPAWQGPTRQRLPKPCKVRVTPSSSASGTGAGPCRRSISA